jgi:hypothetical protein
LQALSELWLHQFFLQVTFIKAVGEGFGVSNLYSKSGTWKKPSSFLAKPSMDAVGFGSLTRGHFAEMWAFFLLQIKQSRSALQKSAKCHYTYT